MKINNVEFNCDMMDVLDKLQSELSSRGSNLLSTYRRSRDFIIVPCPYHGNGNENHPSAEFAEDGSFFYCFTCHMRKSITEVISDCLNENGWNWLRKNFINQKIEERDFDIKLNKEKPKKQEIQYIDKKELDNYRYIHNYILNRGISEETIKKFDVGYDQKNDCITFPNKDINGNILFIATRSTKGKRFNYPYGVKKPIYGFYEISREKRKGKKINEIYIVESMIDALQIWSWGKYAVALNGTGSQMQYKELTNFDCREYILATDNDEAGRLAREGLKKGIKNKIIKELDYKGYKNCKDINDMTKEQFEQCNIIW